MKTPQRSLEEKVWLILQLICRGRRGWTRVELRNALNYASNRALFEPLDYMLAEELIRVEEQPRSNGTIRLVYWGTDRGCALLEELTNS